MAKLILPINDVARKVADAGFTGWQVVTGVAVIAAESRFDAYAINVVVEEFRAAGSINYAFRSLDVGLFQVNTFWNPDVEIVELLDPDQNVRIARRIFEQRFSAKSGTYAEKVRYAWAAWVTYQKGLHRPFEGEALDAARAVGVAA